MKKLVTLILNSFIFCTLSFGQSSIEKFIKGNIADKTAAVRESSESEAVWLSDKAVDFVLESSRIIGNDRELDGLAVAAVLSLPQDYIETATDQTKGELIRKYVALFDTFSTAPNVQISVLSKINSLSQVLDISPFIRVLNVSLYSNGFVNYDPAVVQSVLSFLSVYGNNDSFAVCYNKWADKKNSEYQKEFENVILSLIPVSMNEALSITESDDLSKVSEFFNLLLNNSNRIFVNNLSEIAENVLFNTILSLNSQSNEISDFEDCINCVKILSENKWTRASEYVLSFFEYAKDFNEKGILSDSDLVIVINSLGDVAPLDAVSPLISYLESLNGKVEQSGSVSEQVVIADINTLGAIGDKSAFDALLGVTYYNYPQSVLTAARVALSGLKW